MATENSSGLNTGALIGATSVALLVVLGIFLSLGWTTVLEVPAVEPVVQESVEVEASTPTVDESVDTDLSQQVTTELIESSAQ